MSGVYVSDASRRSTHGNAYLTGIGRGRRIVLFDTLVDRLSVVEAEAVLAHEIGHRMLGHIWKGILASALASFLVFALAGRLRDVSALYGAFGFSGASDAALLVLLIFFAPPLLVPFSPIVSWRSRRNEYQADRFAAVAVGSPSPLSQALLTLSTQNLSNFTPSRLYALFNYSHPSLAQRLAALATVGSE